MNNSILNSLMIKEVHKEQKDIVKDTLKRLPQHIK